MTSKTKKIVGVGVLVAVGLYLWNQSKANATPVFTPIDFASKGVTPKASLRH